MVQFQQQPIIEESIDELVSEQEKKERIQKALEIHMLQNREAHVAPSGQTLFSFTQGDPNAMIGRSHGFAAVGGEEEKKKQPSLEEQQRQQQQQITATEQKAQPLPIRTCPCCVRFLQNTFHMSEQSANRFVGGAESSPIIYGSSTASEGYGMSSSGTYSRNSGGSAEYIGPSGAGGSDYKGSDSFEGVKYAGQKKGYE